MIIVRRNGELELWANYRIKMAVDSDMKILKTFKAPPGPLRYRRSYKLNDIIMAQKRVLEAAERKAEQAKATIRFLEDLKKEVETEK